MRIPDHELMPLKRALYGVGGLHGASGLFPEIRYGEVRERIGPIYRRRSRWSGMTQEYVRHSDYDRAKVLTDLLSNTIT